MLSRQDSIQILTPGLAGLLCDVGEQVQNRSSSQHQDSDGVSVSPSSLLPAIDMDPGWFKEENNLLTEHMTYLSISGKTGESG